MYNYHTWKTLDLIISLFPKPGECAITYVFATSITFVYFLRLPDLTLKVILRCDNCFVVHSNYAVYYRRRIQTFPYWGGGGGGGGGNVFLESKIEFQSNMFYEKSEDETKFGVKKNDKGEIVNIILQHVLTSL